MRTLASVCLVLLCVTCIVAAPGCLGKDSKAKTENVQALDDILGTLNKHGVVYAVEAEGNGQPGFELYQGGRGTAQGRFRVTGQSPVANPLAGTPHEVTKPPVPAPTPPATPQAENPPALGDFSEVAVIPLFMSFGQVSTAGPCCITASSECDTFATHDEAGNPLPATQRGVFRQRLVDGVWR